MEQIIKDLNNFLMPKGIKIYGTHIQDVKDGKTYDQFSSIISGLIQHWQHFSEDERENIARIIMKTNKNYLGDVKWVLYQYICDMNSDKVSIRCGNFAWNKLVPNDVTGVRRLININGENIMVYHISEMDKKQLIISTHEFQYYDDLWFNDMTIYPGDVVLYFA